ncbi:MAG: hypothetical protein M1812_004824 [Candelaria pacifica]|nr:MAG: hypothetical protein M1812_004824 [Candelaria pacifica]
MADHGLVATTPSTPTRPEPTHSVRAYPTTPTSITSTPHILSATESQGSTLLRPFAAYKTNQPHQLPNLTSIASAGLRASPSPISPKLSGLSPGYSPRPLTGAAAMADERRLREDRERVEAQRQSPNPATSALSSLLRGPENGISTPQDAPKAATTMSKPLAAVAEAIATPEPMQVDSNPQTSPVSLTSFGTLDNSTASTATVNSIGTSSPSYRRQDMEASPGAIENSESATASEERSSARALTFPGPLLGNLAGNQSRNPPRGMSLPHSGLGQGSPKSPSAKKHKCPYCSTDFTRHHNLKSHLLTHSHEKPYVCQTCQARFRRLHDLKRHTKLHTGERPHICPKCGRRFARGDALARHNKGQGGCAGRRSSMGSFGGDEDFNEGTRETQDSGQGGSGGEEGMEGLLYNGEGSGETDRMDGDGESAEGRRRLSLPSIKAHDASSAQRSDDPSHNQQSIRQPQQHPSTYPPIATARRESQAAGGLYPPSPSRGGTFGTGPSTAGTSISSAFNIGGTSMFAQGGMTESPKPLSPGGASSHQLGHPDSGSINRHRSPSLTQQFQHHRYGRRDGGRTPPSIGLPPPVHGPGTSHPPQLPALSGLAPPESRYTLPSQASGSQQSPHGGSHLGNSGHSYSSSGTTPASFHSQPTGAPPGGSSAGGSSSSYGHGNGDGSNNVFTSGGDGLWNYVRSLEDRLKRQEEEMSFLKGQLANQNRQHESSSGPG